MIFVLIILIVIIVILACLIKLMLNKKIPYAIRGGMPGFFIWALEWGIPNPSGPGPSLTKAVCDFLGIYPKHGTDLLWLLSFLLFVCPGVFIGIFIDVYKIRKLELENKKLQS
jgi:hypothetical protein